MPKNCDTTCDTLRYRTKTVAMHLKETQDYGEGGELHRQWQITHLSGFEIGKHNKTLRDVT
jgi:hypothetical protein